MKNRQQALFLLVCSVAHVLSTQKYEPGTDAENQTRFEPLEAFLYVLSSDYDLVEELRNRVARLMTEAPDGEWRMTM